MSRIYQQTATSICGFDNIASTASPSSPPSPPLPPPSLGGMESAAEVRRIASEEDILRDEQASNFGTISEDSAVLESSRTTTPDQILTLYGPRNIYLLFVWLAMAAVWGLSAMTMMVSAFLMSEPCPHANCTARDGTIVKEFGLVGERSKLADYTASGFLIGVTIGSLFLPALSDQKGRRPVVLLSLFFLGFFGVGAALAPEIYSFILLRFLQGFFFTGCGITNWVLAYESIPLRLRSYTALTFGLWWVVGYCAVGPLAYYLENWRWLVAAVSAPSTITAVLYYFTLPESFHYVVSRGQSKAVTRWIERANCFADWTNGSKARVNVKEFLAAMQHAESASPSTNDASTLEGGSQIVGIAARKKNLLQQLASNRLLFIYTLVMVYLWTCDTFVYYGLSLFSTQLAGNKYLNFALMGLIEIPSYLVSPFLLNKLGRKCFVSLCHFLAAVAFFAVVLFNNPVVHLVMWLLGKFAISCAFTCLFVYASELFPTIVRNGCIGVCSVVARMGGVLAPTVQAMATISPVMPTFFFGICAAIGGALTLFLPETRNRELPDSPDEMS